MKSRILFVDDEPNVLQGLRRMLRDKRGEWDMLFANGGQEALEVLNKESVDVVVSDMRMPGIDGAELLARVRKTHPETVRIILSGYADEESVLRTVGPAHQYLAKPCSNEDLTGMIQRTLELRRFLSSPDLRSLLSGIETLPTPPDLYFRLVDYLDRPKTSAADVAEIVAKDVAMTAELLKLTNSAYFSLPSKVTSPLQAVRVLGFETMKALILRMGVFRQFAGNANLSPVIEMINRHSLAMAGLARRIAESENMEPHRVGQVFSAGMLCCIGTLVLVDQKPEEFDRVKKMLRTGRSLVEAETEVFGATHSEVGAYLLGLWGFNDPVVEAVAYLLTPRRCTCRDIGVLTCIHAARALGPGCPIYGTEATDPGALLDETYLEKIGASDRIAKWEEIASATKVAP